MQKNDGDETSTVELAPKKKMTKVPSPAKKLKLGVKPLMSSPLAKSNGKVTTASAAAASAGSGGCGTATAAAGAAVAGNTGDDPESESSGTLSSPPAA